MAEEDIYKNKARYERRLRDLDELLVPPDTPWRPGLRRYYCRNPQNLRHFRRLHELFETRDSSYIRRNRSFDFLLFLSAATDKDLQDCEREDIDRIVAKMHRLYSAPESKVSFLKSLKWLWRNLFPELDERGRVDETITPYVVRHLSCAVDKSRQRRRNDKLTQQEFERLLTYFGLDPRMQAYVALAVESLGRPQEICYTRVRDLELHDNYAKVWISEHGKEGTGFLQCIDSYPYLLKWFAQHPFARDPDAFLFPAAGRPSRQLTPQEIGRKLKTACQALGIDKRVTAYSLKRNGVTFRRLRGDSDVEIQHAARWTSTKQLQTYDLSSADDAFAKQLQARGIIPAEGEASAAAGTRACPCGARVSTADQVCSRCKRSTNTNRAITDDEEDRKLRQLLRAALHEPNKSLAQIMGEIRHDSGPVVA